MLLCVRARLLLSFNQPCIRCSNRSTYVHSRYNLKRFDSIASKISLRLGYRASQPCAGTIIWRLRFALPVAFPFVLRHFKGLRLNVQCAIRAKDQRGRSLKQLQSQVAAPPLLASASRKDLWQLIKPEALLIAIAVVSAICVALINIKVPLLLGELINIVAGLDRYSDIGILHPKSIQLVAHYALQSGLTFLYIMVLSIVGENIAARMKNQLFSALLIQDIAFFDNVRTGELMGRLAGDVQEFKSAFKQCLSQGLRAVTQIAGCGISLYIISPKMTMMTVFIVPTVVVIGTLAGSLLRRLSFLAQQQIGRSMMVAEEALSNIRTVRAFAMEKVEEEKFASELAGASMLNTSLGFGIGLFQGATSFLLNGLTLAVIYGGSILVMNEEVSRGDIMSFLVTVQTIQRSMAQMTVLFGQSVQGLSAAGRVFEFIHLKPRIPVSGGSVIPHHSFVGGVDLKNISFRYPSRPEQAVLRDVSLHVPAGRMIALVGKSGAGKSTIAALIERFYDPTSGSVCIDGRDIRSLDPQWLRGQAIGYISQEPVLFSGTIEENIRYGRPGASFDDVIESADKANAHKFIQSFPNGYRTEVGERGVTLSGGQKQRVAIARALLKNPRIMILDEATSALDAESEKLVQEALNEAVKGRTVIVVAHRLSTIQRADCIAVVDNGQVVEVGNHVDLISKKGAYYNLIRLQYGWIDEIEEELLRIS